MSSIVIQTDSLWKEYGDNAVLRDINLSVEEGSMVLIDGRSGSGKTTLLNIIGCMDIPSKGELFIEGEKTTAMNHKQLSQLRLRKIGFVFQEHNLIDSLTVEENIMLPMRIAKHNNGHDRVKELLETFDIGSIRDKKPKFISGGEKQRAAIARALANEPDILLADEPTASLDLGNAEVVMDAFKKANKRYGNTIVVASHDSFVKKRTEKQYTLQKGILTGG